ncbi:AAA family ATPase [Corticibacterium sp. UT-5YL-CI-8]|nr:AAA family ATPase [Tianweitania sp. UT-5YL-CI-8]
MLDLPVAVTRFPSQAAQTKAERQLSMRQLAEEIGQATAQDKSGLPWFKLGSFGERRTEKNCLRNNENLLFVSGIEADYDAGTMSPDEAERRLSAAGIAAMVYTTPSHAQEGKGSRWRVLAPFDTPLSPEKRAQHVARLNGILDGALDGTSFVLSQSYFGGSVKGRPHVDVRLIDGMAINRAGHLDAGAVGKRTAATAAMHDLFEDILGGAPKAKEQLGIERCREILADLPPEWCEDRDSWIRAGMALHHEFGGNSEGFAVWDAWSRHSRKYDAADIKRDWRSFRDKAQIVTMGTLVKAGEANRQARIDRQLDSEFENLGEDDLAKPAPKPKSGLTFLSPSDCSAMPSRGYVIKGFIAPGDIACIFGEPGAGKSMIAPYLGYAVAQGREAFGMRTKPGKVFYLPMEDETGMQMRVRALHEQHGDAENFFVVRGASIHGDEGLKELLLEVKRQQPALIIIDTLAASWPGLEENSSEAMSKVVAVGKRLARFGAAVVFIHHSTKDSNGTPRGHSVLNGALDVSMELFKPDEDGIARGRLRKNRNGPCELDMALRIQSHEFGLDEDGDPITAGYCEPCQPGSAPKAVRLTIPQREALTILRDMATTGDMSPVVAMEEWRQACSQSAKISTSDNRKSVMTAVRRAIEGLLREGFVEKVGETVVIHDPHGVTDDEIDDLGDDDA